MKTTATTFSMFGSHLDSQTTIGRYTTVICFLEYIIKLESTFQINKKF